MKKLLVALLVLVAFGAFAQEAAPAIQFSDSFSTGITYNQPKTGDAMLKLYDNWDNGYALYNDLDLTYAVGDFTWFAEFDTVDATASGQPTFDALSMKGSFFNKMLTAELGMTSNGNFTTLGDKGANWGWMTGAIVTAAPVDGLILGYGLKASAAGAVATDQFKGSILAVSYTMANTFKARASYLMSATAKAADAQVSFALLAVPNLKLNAEAFLYNLGDSTTTFAAGTWTGGYNMFTETVGYTMGNIYAGLVAYEYMPADSSLDLMYNVKPKVSYTMDKTVLSAYFKYYSKNADGTDPTDDYAANVTVKQTFSDQATGWVGLTYAPNSGVTTGVSVAYSF